MIPTSLIRCDKHLIPNSLSISQNVFNVKCSFDSFHGLHFLKTELIYLSHDKIANPR